MTKQYESEVHEAARGLAEAGLMSKRTMRKFDEMCLTPIKEMTSDDIREFRLREHAIQAMFAHYLNVTTGLVRQRECGEKRPHDASLKLLTLVAKNGLGAVARKYAPIAAPRRATGACTDRVRRGVAPWALSLQSSGPMQRGIR